MRSFNRWWQCCGNMLAFPFSWGTQTSAINLLWLTNYITLPFITWVGRLSVNTAANQYAPIFLRSTSRLTLGCELSFQAVNRILHHCPPLSAPAFFIIYLFIFKQKQLVSSSLDNKSFWPTFFSDPEGHPCARAQSWLKKYLQVVRFISCPLKIELPLNVSVQGP